MSAVTVIVFCSGLLALRSNGQDPGPIQIKNRDPEFQFTLPRGYVKNEVNAGQLACSYIRDYGKDPSYRIVVAVEILPGTVSPSEADGDQLKDVVTRSMDPGFQARTIRESWNQRSIPVVEIAHRMNNVDLYCLNAVVPLVPKAVCVNVTGYKGQESEVGGELRRILASFKGKTHWLTPTQRKLAMATGAPAVLAFTLFALYGIAHLVYYRKHPVSGCTARIVWLGTVVLLLVVSGTFGILYEMSKGRSDFSRIGMNNAVQIGVILWCVLLADRINKRRRCVDNPGGAQETAGKGGAPA